MFSCLFTGAMISLLFMTVNEFLWRKRVGTRNLPLWVLADYSGGGPTEVDGRCPLWAGE